MWEKLMNEVDFGSSAGTFEPAARGSPGGAGDTSLLKGCLTRALETGRDLVRKFSANTGGLGETLRDYLCFASR